MSDRVLFYANAIELVLLAAGLICTWRFALSPAGRGRPRAGVPPWPIAPLHFLLFIWIVICGALLGQLGALGILSAYPVKESAQLVFASAGFQFGMLAAIGGFNLNWAGSFPELRLDGPAVRSGLVTFLIAVPALVGSGLLAEAVLQFLHVTLQKQPLVEMLSHEKSPGIIGALIIVATIVAPVVEELIFRAGMFRYLASRFPRWAAHLFPAVFFGLLHSNLASFLPLVALGLVFSHAYERTGRIETSMVAHGLFNLTSTIGVLYGIDRA